MLRSRLFQVFKPTRSEGRAFSSLAPPSISPLTWDIHTTHDPMYLELVRRSIKYYEKVKIEVDNEIQQILNSEKLVLLMDGTPDFPKSTRSLNVIKILTQIQAVPFIAIDVMRHPAFLGYATQKCHKMMGPFLFKDGHFNGNHDDLLKAYESGQLERLIGTPNRESNPRFKGLLPIGLY